MGKRTPKLFILDILESAQKIEEYVKGMDFDDFSNDEKTIDAVVRKFEIIGEAANNIPQEIKIKHLDVDWRMMIGMRNVLAHEYFGTELEVVWDAIKEDIPIVKLLMENVLKDLEDK